MHLLLGHLGEIDVKVVPLGFIAAQIPKLELALFAIKLSNADSYVAAQRFVDLGIEIQRYTMLEKLIESPFC